MAGLVVASAIVALGAITDLLRIRADLDDGRRRLEQLDLDTLRADGLEATLAAAADDLHDAAERADASPFLAVGAVVPVVDDQVDAIRDLTAAADQLGGEARATGATIAAAIDRAGAGGPARVDLLDAVLSELGRIEAVAATIDLGADGTLVGPLRTARADVADSLDSIPERFDPLEAQIAALRRLLAGPSTYLIGVGNNAEMRAGAGMPLSAGLATIVDGEIDLGEFESTVSELYTPDPSGEFNTDIAPELRETYPRWNLGRDFPETAVIPHFPVTAPIYADIAADTQGWRTDGVVHIDAMALAELLEVVGPVDVGGVTYTAESAPQLVLNQPYLDFDTADSRSQRLDVQSDLANALFEAIQDRDLDLLDVVAALQEAAEGRHLMAWSRDPVLQDLFDSFGAAGAVDPTETLVSFQNTAANKLDWYIRPTIELDVEAQTTDEWLVTIEATITNPDDIVTSAYADGILPGLEGGTHRMLLTVQAPAAATGLAIPDHEVTEFGHDGISPVIGTRFTIPRGSTETVEVQFRLPRGTAGLSVVPSARATPVPWSLGPYGFDDDAPFRVPFGRFPDPADDTYAPPAVMAVLVAAAGVGMLARGAQRAAGDGRGARLARIDNATGTTLLAVAFALAGAAVLIAG